MRNFLLYTLVLFSLSLQAQTKLLSSITETYDGITYTNNYGEDYLYDNNNNLIELIQYTWDGANWNEISKYLFSYNTDNRSTEIIFQSFNGSSYLNLDRITYNYNSNGKPTEAIAQSWNGAQWENSNKYEILYTGNLMDSGIFSDWDGTQWVNEERTIYTYSGNSITEFLFEFWDGSQWLSDDAREILTYNGNDKLVSNEFQFWTGANWVSDETINFEYDSDENRTRKTTTNPIGQNKREYTYDTSVLLSNFAHPFLDKTGFDYEIGIEIQETDFLFDDIPFINKILSYSMFEFNNSSNSFIETSRTTFNYDSTLSNENFFYNSIRIYPNPTTDYLNINGLESNAQVEIFNLLGEKVFEKNINKDQNFNIEYLNTGIYVLRINKMASYKLVKE